MKRIVKLLFVMAVCFHICFSNAYAHSGRTDGSGGHKDNKNASGLGSYHYHHGYSAHLHKNGICPYTAIKVKSIKVEGSTNECAVGDTIQLCAVIAPENASYSIETWTSSDDEIATVSAKGLVTAKKKGVVTITAKSEDGKTGKVKLTILNQPIMNIIVTEEIILHIGETDTIDTLIEPENATNKNLIWSSSDSTIVSVDSGRITAFDIGEVTINVSCEDGIDKTIKVNVVEKKIEELTISNPLSEMVIGDTVDLVCTFYPIEAVNTDVTWASSDYSVIHINDNGKIIALKEGTATISVLSDNGISASIHVLVNPIAVIEVQMSINEIKLYVDEKSNLNAIIYPIDATYSELIWSSSDPLIASVNSNGEITALKKGKAVITAKAHNGIVGRTSIIIIEEQNIFVTVLQVLFSIFAILAASVLIYRRIKRKGAN